VTQAYVKYDPRTGKSTGTAEIHYANRDDARKAQRELNGRLVDQAPMTVRLGFESAPSQSRGRPMSRGSQTREFGKRNNPNEMPQDPRNPLQR